MRLISVSLALVFLSFSASASQDSVGITEPGAKEDALLHERALEEDIALALAPIKSRKALNAHLRNTANSMSPLQQLSPGARKRFLNSVTFNEKGITGFSYDDLEAELTPSQIYRVLSLFGAQHLTKQIRGARVESEVDRAIMETPIIVPKAATSPIISPMSFPGDVPACPTQPCDYAEYKCIARATCESSTRHICMRSC